METDSLYGLLLLEKKQTVTWNNADQDLQHHMVSSGYGEIMF